MNFKINLQTLIFHIADGIIIFLLVVCKEFNDINTFQFEGCHSGYGNSGKESLEVIIIQVTLKIKNFPSPDDFEMPRRASARQDSNGLIIFLFFTGPKNSKNNLYLRSLMNILIKQAKIADSYSPFNGQTADIFIENGIIISIGKKISKKADQEISIDGLILSPGWVDVFAHFNDPGKEHKETLETGAAAAAAGGFTDVLVIPNSTPALHNKANIEYIAHKSKNLPVTIHPIGAITKNTDGKELAEMYDMHSSGAVAFSDGLNPVQSAGLLLKALLYVKAIDSTIIQIPDDSGINPHGLMNEGVASTQLGLPGKPALAEELVIARDLKLARYTESKIHFTAVTTKKSLEYIKRSKESGIAVTCSVTPYHLFFSDNDLNEYDSNLKVNPPLRTIEEKNALINAVKDDTVDCIATHHLPHEKDSKVVEFEYAANGMIGLETAYAVINTAVEGLSVERTVELFSANPRKIFGLNPVTINENEIACLTLFIPDKKWIFTENDIKSKSKNSPFIGKELKGKVIGIINKGQVLLNLLK